MLVFQSEPVVSKSSLSSTCLKALGMQRFIKGMAIGIFCLQWSLPVSAGTASCEPIIKLAQPLIATGPFVTQIATVEVSYFRLTCSCNAGEALMGTANLQIVDPKVVRNGFATISSGSNNDLEKISDIDLTVTTSTPGVFEAEVTYSVKVSTLNGEQLNAGPYSVTVQFESNPQCTPTGMSG
jgi:hypothetical protein